MKKLIGNLAVLILLLLVIAGCNDSTPNVLGEIKINDGYSEEVNIEDFETGVELPKAAITAYYTNGNSVTVTSNVSYSAVKKDGETTISDLIAKEKGVYEITATYKEGEVSKSASYSVTVTGPERLLIESLEGLDNYYAGDTYKKEDIRATIQYENIYGEVSAINDYEIKIENEDGTEVSEEFTAGNYKIIFSSNGLSVDRTFTVSAGLLPIRFELSGDTVPESVNKEKNQTLDLSNLTIKAYYEDGEKKADRELTIISSEGKVEEGVTLSLTSGETTVGYSNGFALANFNKGDNATLNIKVQKSFLKAVKVSDGKVEETTYSGEKLEGDLEAKEEILITVNPSIEKDTLKVVTNESTADVPYVENDTVELKNISFSYDDGTGKKAYTVTADSEGVEVTKGEEKQSSSFNLFLGENKITVTYNGAEASTTINAVEAAKAVAIKSIVSDLTKRYEVNSATETTISIPDEITMRVAYEDGCEKEITVTDTSNFTFTLTWKTSLGANALSEPMEVTKDNPVKLTTDNVGLYDLKITYSNPEGLKHRQEKTFEKKETTELSYDYGEDIEIIQSAVIKDIKLNNSTQAEFKEYVEGDVIKPNDVTFTFINIYGEEDKTKTNAGDENFTLYINDNPVAAEGYTLTDEETTYYVSYNDNAGVTATSEEKTISPLPLLTPISVVINENEALSTTINMEDKINNLYTIDNLSVTLTYADDETTVVNVIENGGIVDDSFIVTIGETPYGEFKYSYDASSLGEQTVTVTLENGKAHSKRQIKAVEETTSLDLNDSYTVTIERNPIIKNAKYTLPEGKTLYNNSKINTSDISFIYVDNHGKETTINGNNEGVTCSINGTDATDGTLTIPEKGSTVTICISYKEIESPITIEGILEDEPAKLLIEDSVIETEYNATSPLFSETIADSVELQYLSEKVELISKNDLTFKIGENEITTEGNILKAHEGSPIDVYYGEYKVYTTGKINYNAVKSLKAVKKENIPLAIVQTEDTVDAKDFVESVTLVFEDSTEENYDNYSFSVSGDTNTLRAMITLTPSVTINGDTVVDSENALTVQVVANEYERAGYDDVLTITGETADFSIPEVFNRTKDGTAIFFLGYYDEEGTELTYEEGDIYVTTEGEAILDDTYAYPVDYEIKNTIHNTKGKEVRLHPIYAPVSDYATLADGVLTDNPEFPTIDSSIIGIPAEVKTISAEMEDESPFLDNTSIKMVVFETGTEIEKLYQRAFARMELKYFELPDSVTILGLGAFADCTANAEEAYIEISKESQLESIGSYAFSNTNFVNFRIPASVNTISGATFPDSKYLSVVIIDEREDAISLPDGLFNGNNKGINSIYIPENVSLSENTFGGMSIGKIIIDGQQNTSEFADASPWGAVCDDIQWLIANKATAIATDYPTYLVSGEEFTATLEIIAADGSERTENGVSFTAPEEPSGEQTFTLTYNIDGQDVEVEFNAIFVDAKITDDETLSAFLSSKGTVGYVSNGFTTDGFTLSGKTLFATEEVELILTSVAEGSNSYVSITGDATIENIKFSLNIATDDTEHYLLSASDADSLTLSGVTINNAGTKTTRITGYFNNISGTFESLKVSGNVTVPLWFNNSQITLSDYHCDNSGSYDYSRFMLEGTENKLKFTGNVTGVLDRFCSTEATGAENYVDFTESNIKSVWTNSIDGNDGDLHWYSYKNN